jgi:TRAP-type C4-dicarboxylate transport system permease small subunit
MGKEFLRVANTMLEGLAKLLVGLSFGVLIVAVVIQVAGRSVFFDSPVWTEELARFALLYLAAFGVGLSYLRGDLVNVDMICESLPGRFPWLLRLISAVIIAVLSCALLGPAWKFTGIGAYQTSPALGWRMDYVHASVLLLLGSLLLFALLRIISMLSGISTGSPENFNNQERDV